MNVGVSAEMEGYDYECPQVTQLMNKQKYALIERRHD